jgi:hypothetical protein
MENSDFQQSVYLVDWTIAGARFTRHRYEGSVVHKSGAIRCSRVAIPLGSGLFCGQRLCEKKRALPLPKPLPVILILVSIAFFAWL